MQLRDLWIFFYSIIQLGVICLWHSHLFQLPGLHNFAVLQGVKRVKKDVRKGKSLIACYYLFWKYYNILKEVLWMSVSFKQLESGLKTGKHVLWTVFWSIELRSCIYIITSFFPFITQGNVGKDFAKFFVKVY